MKDSLEQLIYDETAKRLQEMESPEYEFPKPMGKVDFAVIVGLAAACVVLIVLCMTGVIA